MTAYYNEHDPFAAAWLRELIKAGLIAPGDVDERSIEDVRPDELVGYTQCHFFAGIGGWSYALRLAGWPDDRPVWTGSCPCQPYSAAGQGKGFADERHLWPAWFHLIAQCDPDVIFSEQVEAAINHGWLDLVQSDLEGEGYAIGFIGLPAAGVGAPHIRQRLWFVAEPYSEPCRQGRAFDGGRNTRSNAESRAGLGGGERIGIPVEHATSEQMGISRCTRERREAGVALGDTQQPRLEGQSGHGDDGNGPGRQNADAARSVAETCATGGFWHPADWIPCRDGKARPVEPGTFPLAHGVPARVGRLRGYGNAIVPQVAAEVIAAYMEIGCQPK